MCLLFVGRNTSDPRPSSLTLQGLTAWKEVRFTMVPPQEFLDALNAQQAAPESSDLKAAIVTVVRNFSALRRQQEVPAWLVTAVERVHEQEGRGQGQGWGQGEGASAQVQARGQGRGSPAQQRPRQEQAQAQGWAQARGHGRSSPAQQRGNPAQQRHRQQQGRGQGRGSPAQQRPRQEQEQEEGRAQGQGQGWGQGEGASAQVQAVRARQPGAAATPSGAGAKTTPRRNRPQPEPGPTPVQKKRSRTAVDVAAILRERWLHFFEWMRGLNVLYREKPAAKSVGAVIISVQGFALDGTYHTDDGDIRAVHMVKIRVGSRDIFVPSEDIGRRLFPFCVAQKDKEGKKHFFFVRRRSPYCSHLTVDGSTQLLPVRWVFAY